MTSQGDIESLYKHLFDQITKVVEVFRDAKIAKVTLTESSECSQDISKLCDLLRIAAHHATEMKNAIGDFARGAPAVAKGEPYAKARKYSIIKHNDIWDGPHVKHYGELSKNKPSMSHAYRVNAHTH
ncbi:MAG: hypothetical protein WCF85_21440 [Rhodospirillaceae bacterium]